MEIFLPHPVKSLRVTEAYKRKALFRIKVARPNTWRPLLPSENRCSSCICLLVDKIERENSVTEQPKSNL